MAAQVWVSDPKAGVFPGEAPAEFAKKVREIGPVKLDRMLMDEFLEKVSSAETHLDDAEAHFLAAMLRYLEDWHGGEFEGVSARFAEALAKRGRAKQANEKARRRGSDWKKPKVCGGCAEYAHGVCAQSFEEATAEDPACPLFAESSS